MKTILFIPIILFFVACDSTTTKERPIKKAEEESIVSETAFFDTKQDFEILSFEQSIDETSSASDADAEIACDGWSVTKDECKKLIAEATAMSGVEWHHLYDVLPCIYSGKIKQGENTYKYKFNSGDWFVVYNADTSIYLSNGEPEVVH